MFTGRWRNSNGSEMVLTQSGEAISGVYITEIGHDRATGREHLLAGRATGDLIGFVVAWPAANSLTSWAGRLVWGADGGAAIHTVWHLARAEIAGDPPRTTAPWESFLTNASIFTRLPE